MSLLDVRTAVTALLAAGLALGVVAAPVAADDGDVDVGVNATTQGNSTLDLDADAASEQGGLDGHVNCEGDLTTVTHQCDKGGNVSGGPVDVDYDGENYADPPALRGGGGDRFTVTVADQSGTAGFYCVLTVESVTGGDACSVNTSSPGPAPAPGDLLPAAP